MKISCVAAFRWLGLALFIAGLSFASGCGEGGPANSVSGKVTMNGEPVMGIIHFVGSGKEATGSVGLTGEYFVADPPLGEVSILIKSNAPPNPTTTTPPPNATGAMPGMPSGVKGPATPPAKYADASGGLKYTVVAGKQVHNIELTP
jgi:hypothetical protein